MSQIVINTINGTPPYTIYVCDLNQYSCSIVATSVPSVPPSITITIPSIYNSAPIFIVKIIDSLNCEYIQNYSCQTPTPTPTNTQTPTITPTNTATPSVTPTNTPSSVTPTPTPTNTQTPTITPTNTPTNTQTPSITPTNTITPSITPSITPTISLTSSVTPTQGLTPTPTPSVNNTVAFRNYFFILAEPLTGASRIAEYMVSSGSTFLGFSNGSSPSVNQNDFQVQMNLYMDFSGFTNSTGGFKVYTNASYENSIINGPYNVDRNFSLTTITANTLPTNSWYTIFIATAFTLSNYQSEIGIGIGQSEILSPIFMDPNYYGITLQYTGSSYLPNVTYRVYTTYPSTDLLLNNSGQDIYFKGLTLTS
jgi:hypothetical protein